MRKIIYSIAVVTMLVPGAVPALAQSQPQTTPPQQSASKPSSSFSKRIYEQILIMAGPLADNHAELEKNCANCHENSNYKAAPDKLCAACHKDVARDIDAKLGFHGRRKDIAGGRSCISCHTDHKGRDFDTVGLDTQLFDHNLTDLVLKGAHAARSSDCTSCHAPDEKHRKAGNECIDCHGAIDQTTRSKDAKTKRAANPRKYRLDKTSDPHSGRLPDCVTCHEESSWKKLKPFDHAKATLRSDRPSFALIGKHAKITCDACHKLQPKVRAVPRGCVTCHKQNDNHNGEFGETCDTCHSEKGWKKSATCPTSQTLAANGDMSLEARQLRAFLAKACVDLKAKNRRNRRN